MNLDMQGDLDGDRGKEGEGEAEHWRECGWEQGVSYVFEVLCCSK